MNCFHSSLVRSEVADKASVGRADSGTDKQEVLDEMGRQVIWEVITLFHCSLYTYERNVINKICWNVLRLQQAE